MGLRPHPSPQIQRPPQITQAPSPNQHPGSAEPQLGDLPTRPPPLQPGRRPLDCGSLLPLSRSQPAGPAPLKPSPLRTSSRRLWTAGRITALPAHGVRLPALSQPAPSDSAFLTSHFSLLTSHFPPPPPTAQIRRSSRPFRILKNKSLLEQPPRNHPPTLQHQLRLRPQHPRPDLQHPPRRRQP